MNTILTPKITQQLGDCYILWFEPSNSYVILDAQNMHLLQLFLASNGIRNQFFKKLNHLNRYSTNQIQSLYTEIATLVQECSKKAKYNVSLLNQPNEINLENNSIDYNYGFHSFRVHYSSKKVKQLIHPQIAHLSSKPRTKICASFNIYLKDDTLYLLKEGEFRGCFHKTEYHLLQGKFAMELICLLTNTTENDWIATFHASTITNGNEAIMIIGDSGNGKSTLSALLMAHGFSLVADDLTPMCALNQHVYDFPAAISIKHGAFAVLQPIIKNFDSYANTILSPSKGYIKHIPYAKEKNTINHYPCRKIVRVHYKKNAQTVLHRSTIASNLATLIPDSWISPSQEHAEAFINWLKNVEHFELEYSNTAEAIDVFNSLFKS